ncbi:branched-chain amino acid transport system permease protein/neutral amino acid transport system permease protein [Bosea sp. AK1]|uniref:branched-chain amino acid ABC transporter permease n=1 Tax=Bosea sp. AK1 TaxID=2587160 RepID=UPI00114D5D55|nr:branched-chain amino acid ABC transporter permease [Bosea sp. AK1]TQI65286.1 branched-chain amino acid transport system permease protein/neutral amino acid transport system permease protein [Bosea sp. AK1]
MTEVFQAFLNGLMAGSLLAIPAIGFTTIFAVLRYPSFSIAAYATIGAFAGWAVDAHVLAGVLPALIVAAIVAGMAGVVGERRILAPLLPAGSLMIAIGSVALNLVLENIVRFVYGNELRSFNIPIEQDIVFGDLRVGPLQIRAMLCACALMIAVFALLKFTRFGRAMRAVADNADLARLKGIDPNKIANFTVALSAALIGMSGVLLGLETSIDPFIGNRILLAVFAAAVLGGLGSIPGAVAGALALGIAEELALLVVPSLYRSAVGFAAILLMLTFRPRGLLGERAH